MTSQLEQISQQQKDSWNKSSAGWKRWDSLMMEFLGPVGDEMIRLLAPHGNDVVLDIAAGTGEPGLTIAPMLSGGKVVSADLAEEMLAIASERAAAKGIANFETCVADISALPFADNTFDVISCRYGFMFFPDMDLAVREMIRVLKPGGRLAAAVWLGPEKNFWVKTVLDAAARQVELPTPPPGAPSMFRCAAPGKFAELFRQNGLKDISEIEIAGALQCDAAETYWNFTSQCVGPFVSALAMTDEEGRQKIHRDVIETIDRTYPDGNIALPSSTLILYGRK